MTGLHKKITDPEIAILKSAANDQRGVVYPPGGNGYARITKLRRIQKLVRLGLLESNAHGDWYITDTGRRVVYPGFGGTK